MAGDRGLDRQQLDRVQPVIYYVEIGSLPYGNVESNSRPIADQTLLLYRDRYIGPSLVIREIVWHTTKIGTILGIKMR